MKVKTWTKDGEDSFSEYLYPPSDKGTKMLKLDEKLWIYNPGADRIIPISGHMLRQSVMGSDLSYEDFMENQTLRESYKAQVIGDEVVFGRQCWILELSAVTDDVAYVTRKIWVDKVRSIALKEELFGKSGKLLKKTEIPEVFRIQNRWYPKKMTFKDMLRKGNGTEIIIDDVQFDVKIPKSKFSKAALK
jgi:outer membrane lipoprotein-sorting protein